MASNVSKVQQLGMSATGVLTIVPSAAFVVESVTVPFQSVTGLMTGLTVARQRRW